jgi:predicted SnoaL-like aldol condensation-catalyzing enzyme
MKGGSMSTPEENKALVRRFYGEMDKGNIDAMDRLVAKDYINHDPPPFPDLAQGRAGLKQAFEMFWKGTPGITRSRTRSRRATKSSHA